MADETAKENEEKFRVWNVPQQGNPFAQEKLGGDLSLTYCTALHASSIGVSVFVVVVVTLRHGWSDRVEKEFARRGWLRFYSTASTCSAKRDIGWILHIITERTGWRTDDHS